MLDRGEAPLLARGEAPFELGCDEVDSGEGDEENFAIIALTPPALLRGASDLCDSCTDVLCVCCSGCDEEETEASAVALELTRLRSQKGVAAGKRVTACGRRAGSAAANSRRLYWCWLRWRFGHPALELAS